jgi:hypothetical protein
VPLRCYSLESLGEQPIRPSSPLCLLALLLPAFLAACAGSGKTSLLDGQAPQAEPALDPAIATSQSPPLADLGNGPFTAGQITAIVSGRSWRYEFRRIRGTITYNADGTMTYDEEGKGKGTGRWSAGDYTLCETRYPTPFLPQGRMDDCSGFRRAGGHYYLGGARLTPLAP